MRKNQRKNERYQRHLQYFVVTYKKRGDKPFVEILHILGNSIKEILQGECVFFLQNQEENVRDTLQIQAEEVIEKETDIFENAVYAVVRVQSFFDKVLWKQGVEKICYKESEYKFDVSIVHKPKKRLK